jgi:hypothetical protein
VTAAADATSLENAQGARLPAPRRASMVPPDALDGLYTKFLATNMFGNTLLNFSTSLKPLNKSQFSTPEQ